MSKKLRIFSLCFLFCMTEFVFARSFEDNFYKFLSSNKQDLSKIEKFNVKKFQYVFITGFMNESAAEYFNNNIETLIKAGVPTKAISILRPSSQQSAVENLTYLQRNLMKPSSKKLVLIGHSKGATELLLFAMKNLAFIQENVQAIFLIQGAFLGSPVADFVLGGGHEIDEQLPVECQISMREIAVIGEDLAHVAYNGLKSLTTEEAEAVWPNDPNELSEIKSILDKKVFYIRSLSEYPTTSEIAKGTECYLQTYYGENDGAVLLNQQYLQVTGSVIGTIWGADHFDFTVPSPISNKDSSYRHAFTKALLTYLSDSL